MIRTVSRHKLPSFLAYPVGAQLITNALVTPPRSYELELYFVRNRYRYHDVENAHLVLTACYRKWNMGLSASRSNEAAELYGPTWQAWIYSVPRTLSALIRAALIDHGFEWIRDWYARPRTELWLTTSHELKLYYSPTGGRLTVNVADT